MSKVALILGIIGVLIGGGVLLVSLALPSLTNGRTSWEEAMFGIIPGLLVFFFSFILAVTGLGLILRKKMTSRRQTMN